MNLLSNLIYTTSKFERANQLLKATNSKRFLFLGLFNLSVSFRTQSDKKPCLRFAKFNFSEKVQNIFEIRLKKIWSDRRKSLSEKNIWKQKIRRQLFAVLNQIKPATVQTNVFPFACSFQKRHLDFVKTSTIHFISKFLEGMT